MVVIEVPKRVFVTVKDHVITLFSRLLLLMTLQLYVSGSVLAKIAK